ncbi:Uncharacterized protein OBRU01_10287 [Operophtera brumata]|uniref:Uncharacterized protein n=1 Tax=Operophtera brumata TaxID=104452 RepID=A0A0L7LF67_OPEBR|nr:Uncharacterized protein OBRU01_10287 [Operophtera brumata]
MCVTELESPKGVVRYALSDRSFIDKGWTMLPIEKVVKKLNVYRMRPAHPEFNWFQHNKNKRQMLYDSGEKLAEFDDKGRGRCSGDPDERGRAQPYTLLATFDYLGNGIVFDHSGKIRRVSILPYE